MADPVHIVIADENPVLVSSLAALLTDALALAPGDVSEVVPVAATPIADARPDLVILDPLLTETLSSLVADLRRSLPGVALVAYASRPTTELARYCLENGFRAFLPKTMTATSFLRAIRVVRDGGTFVHKSFVREMRDIDMAPGAGCVLSEREETTLRLVAMGYSNREIAARLNLSIKTVDTHRGRAMKKLAIETRPELVRVACARGWLF